MKNEKRIPFEIIEKAIVGEPEAIQASYAITEDMTNIYLYFKGHYKRRYSRTIGSATDTGIIQVSF